MKITDPHQNGPFLNCIRQNATLQPCGLSFAEFMELSLYHSIHGYYSRPRPIGKQGDFFTSVSVGSCFGELLARQIRQIHQTWGAPSPFCVIEQGAHSGELARDILQTWPGLSYRLVEPLPALREFQLHTLHHFKTAIRHVAHLQELQEPNAVFVCNELLDAFPVRRLHFTNEGWEEWRVVPEGDTLQLQSISVDQTGMELPAWLPREAPEGFTLEVCPSLRPWLTHLTSAVERGVALIIDYGLTWEERLAPERSGGTLRAYHQHHLVENPLEHPGETDLTSHVDFSSVMEAATDCGWEIVGFTDQARFLTGIAVPWLRSLEGQPDHPLLAQFKTLTHPGIMGRAFRVLALSKNSPSLHLDGFQFGPGKPRS